MKQKTSDVMTLSKKLLLLSCLGAGILGGTLYAASVSTTVLPMEGSYSEGSALSSDDMNNIVRVLREAQITLQGISSLEKGDTRDPSDNFIGIGIGNPQAKLHVGGDVRADGSICDNNGNCLESSVWEKDSLGIVYEPEDSPLATVILKSPVNTNAAQTYGSGIKFTNADNKWMGMIKALNSDTPDGSGEELFAIGGPTSNQEHRSDLIIDNQGNIGIGATDPNEKLHVKGSILAETPTGESGSELIIRDNLDQGVFMTSNGSTSIGHMTKSGDQFLWGTANAVFTKNKIQLTASDINLSSILGKFEILSSADVDMTTTNAMARLNIKNSANNPNSTINGSGVNFFDSEDQYLGNIFGIGGAIKFLSINGPNTQASRHDIKIDNQGRVGIGKSLPYTEKFEVEGNILAANDDPALGAAIYFQNDLGNKGGMMMTGSENESNIKNSLDILNFNGGPINIYSAMYNQNEALSIHAQNLGDSMLQVGIGLGKDVKPSERFEVNGNIKATDFLYASDRNLKENIKPIESSLDKVLKLEGVTFDWKESGEPSVGLIAQDVEKVFPELVRTAETDGTKSLKYANLVAPLIEAVKEQQAEIEMLKADHQSQIDALKAEIEALKKESE